MGNSKIVTPEKKKPIEKIIYLNKYNREYYKKVKMLRDYKPIPLEAKQAIVMPGPVEKKIVEKIWVTF